MGNTSFSEWRSPISSKEIFEESLQIQYLSIDDKENLYWQERRPAENGRVTIVKKNLKEEELLKEPFSAKTKVHEYGGVSYLVDKDRIFFSNGKDQRLYCLSKGKTFPISTNLNFRYANGTAHPTKNYLYYVREEHFSDREPKNTIVLIDLENKEEKIVAEGHDFYTCPALSKDGKQLAFIAWDHPNMPWDSSSLYICSVLEDGMLSEKKKIAGDENISCMEPKWSSDNRLFFIDDRTGFWNIYSYSNGNTEAIYSLDVEFGYPHWVFGITTYALLDDKIVATYIKEGAHFLGVISDGRLQEIKTEFVAFDDLCAQNDFVYFVGGLKDRFSELVKLELSTGKVEVIKKTSSLSFSKEIVSEAECLFFLNSQEKKTHAYYYPPKNPEYFSNALSPVIVRPHSGPTTKASSKFSAETQFWTSRGFAVVDVNYGGSSGFGREYRERLNGGWGKVDVDDCVSCVDFLIKEKKIDPDKIIIKGKSAGGYTALCALTFTDRFKVGCSYYGIGDLEDMVKHTHKFEKHYTDSLIGPYPEEKNLYYNRSPIHFAENLKCPLLLFQGKEDNVVSYKQAEKVFSVLKSKGICVSYFLFESEGHGFRDAAILQKSLEAELYFYKKIFGVPQEEGVSPIKIENMES